MSFCREWYLKSIGDYETLIREKKESQENVECNCCGWKGTENDLVVDYYDSYNQSNPIAINCPECGTETEE